MTTYIMNNSTEYTNKVLDINLFYEIERINLKDLKLISEYTKNKLLELEKIIEENVKINPQTNLIKSEKKYKNSSSTSQFNSSNSFQNKNDAKKNKPDFSQTKKPIKTQTVVGDIVFNSIPRVSKTPIEAQMSNIKILLNKMTEKNYDKFKESLLLMLNDINEEKLFEDIFMMLSESTFNSKLYANLFSSLIISFPIFKKILMEKLDKFVDVFIDFKYVDDDKNYTDFCKMNKDMDKRKGFTTFCMNLSKNNTLHFEDIIKIIRKILQLIADKLNNETNKNLIDDLTENMSIYFLDEELNKLNIKNGFTFNLCPPKQNNEDSAISTSDVTEQFSNININIVNNSQYQVDIENLKSIKWNNNNISIYEFISILKSSSPKIYKGLTSKSIFKFQDIFKIIY